MTALVKGDLRGIATARALSVATVANMKQKLGFAFVYKALGVPLAAGVLSRPPARFSNALRLRQAVRVQD